MHKLVLLLVSTVFALPVMARTPESNYLNPRYPAGSSIDDPLVPHDPSLYDPRKVKPPREYREVMDTIHTCRNIWDNTVIKIGNRWGELWRASATNDIKGHVDPEKIKVSYEKLKYWNGAVDWEFAMLLSKNPTQESCVNMANNAESFIDAYVNEGLSNPYFFYGLPSMRNQITPF